MEFAAPHYGWLVIPVLLVLLLALRGESASSARLQRLAEPRLLRGLVGDWPLVGEKVPVPLRLRRLLRLLLPTAAMLLLVIAAMRPQWGMIEEEQASSGLDIVFALDLSRSMLADDVVPSRLAAAKAIILKAVNSFPGDRIGLVGFAGTAFEVCPLTSEHEMVTRILGETGAGTLPRGGSSLASGLREGARALHGAEPGGKVLVILSDGEDDGGEIVEAINELHKEGIATLATLVGTTAGGLMPLDGKGFVKDREGAVVKSRANLSTLRLIDPATASFSGDPAELSFRIASLREELRESVHKERRRRLAERYSIPLAAALILWLPSVISAGRRART